MSDGEAGADVLDTAAPAVGSGSRVSGEDGVSDDDGSRFVVEDSSASPAARGDVNVIVGDLAGVEGEGAAVVSNAPA